MACVKCYDTVASLNDEIAKNISQSRMIDKRDSDIKILRSASLTLERENKRLLSSLNKQKRQASLAKAEAKRLRLDLARIDASAAQSLVSLAFGSA